MDAHIHTSLSDGEGSCFDYIEQATSLGMTSISFAEHMNDTSAWFEHYIEQKTVIQTQAKPLKVYFAGEVKLADWDGCIDMHPSRLSKLDYVIGVLHSYPSEEGGYHKFEKLSHEEARELVFTLSVKLLTNPFVDVWGHPLGTFTHYYGEYELEKLEYLLELAVHNGKVIELNGNPRYQLVFEHIVRKCIEMNCLVSIGSDAHAIHELGQVLAALKKVLF
jgi:histidinol phosphatase-like PHP family hydrolase